METVIGCCVQVTSRLQGTSRTGVNDSLSEAVNDIKQFLDAVDTRILTLEQHVCNVLNIVTLHYDVLVYKKAKKLSV